jgi:pimeloyl-ACP methyl ester carboxylesterase
MKIPSRTTFDARMQLHFETHDGVGPYLLLAHGFLMSRAQWLPNLPALSHVCRPVVVELLGHGRSSAPSDAGSYHPDTYVAAFDHIRRSLGAQRWWMCGYSLGAGLTIRYALTHPDRVFGHAFTNSTSAFADVDQTESWKNGAEEAAARIESGGVDAIERMPVHPRHAKRLPKDLYDALMTDAARLSPIGVANTLRYTNPNATIRARVGENTVPALLMCGREEARFAPHREFARARMPDLSIVDLPAGHGVNMEDAPGFNRALTEFVTGRSR